MMAKRIFILIVLFLLTISGIDKAFAYNPDITRYSTYIKVDIDGKAYVNEYIKAIYYAPVAGFIKVVPLNGYYGNKPKANEEYNIKIDNIDVNKDFNIYNDKNNNKYIDIGSKNFYNNGEQNYSISYTYKISDNNLRLSDRFYCNLVDTTWAYPVSNYSFAIILPKNFDGTKITFYDKYGESKQVVYEKNKNKIKGYYKGTLYPHDFLSVKIDLPKGYFNKTLSEIIKSFVNYIIFCIPFLILFIVSGMWYVYDKNVKINKISNGIPPKGYNAVDLAYICYHHIDKNIIPALLIHLANSGYLQIEESNILLKEKDFKIIKVKDYDGNDICEKYFFNAIFENKKVITYHR